MPWLKNKKARPPSGYVVRTKFNLFGPCDILAKISALRTLYVFDIRPMSKMTPCNQRFCCNWSGTRCTWAHLWTLTNLRQITGNDWRNMPYLQSCRSDFVFRYTRPQNDYDPVIQQIPEVRQRDSSVIFVNENENCQKRKNNIFVDENWNETKTRK